MRRRFSLQWLLPLLLALAPAGVAPAQESDEVPTISIDGPDVFCYLLQQRKLTAIPAIEELRTLAQEDTIVILFGEMNVLKKLRPALGGDLRQYQKQGGSILFASDFRVPLTEWGVVVSGDRIQQEQKQAYRENVECPLIRALEPQQPLEIPLLPRGLATNRPSDFRVNPRTFVNAVALRPMASFGADCAATEARIRNAQGGVEPAPMRYAYSVRQDAPEHGRALLFAGHGIFTNGMLLQKDNDNFDFAAECLRWLSVRPDGTQRTHALFIIDGGVIPTFDVSLKPPVPPIPRPTIAVVNQLLRGMEKEGILFHILGDTVDVQRAVQVGLIALTIGLSFYGAKKLAEQRYHPETGSALVVGPNAAAANIAPLSQQRLQAQVRYDALWGEARALVRAWFFDVGGIALDDGEHRRVPEFSVAGGWWQRYRMRRQVSRLAQLAAQREPTPFSWRELVRLSGTLHALRDAVREGRLRFRSAER
jgi:hypothetical protein